MVLGNNKMKELRTRKNIRLKNYDYSQNGAYFVTICTYNREPLLGRIVGADDPVRPFAFEESETGRIVSDCWNKINAFYENIRTDKFVVMPNHIHGIIFIDNMDVFIGNTDKKRRGLSDGEYRENTGGQSRPPLQKIIQGYKSVTTRMCFQMGCQKIWQRSYYDHIIRNESEYQKIWEYITANPLNWKYDIYFV